MRTLCLLSLLTLSFHLQPAQAERDTSIYQTDVNIYKTDPHVYKDAGGMPIAPVSCEILINKQWSFNSPGAVVHCRDAVRACDIERLMAQHLEKPLYRGKQRDIVKSDLQQVREYRVYSMKLCQLAIDAHNAGIRSPLEYTGLL